MRITKKEAERIFNNGGTVYGYSKLAVNEFDYLDIDTTNLSPLMVRTISEMKDETLSLAEAEKSALLVDINAMHTRIVESDFPVSFLQEYQKVLTKYAPPVESTTLTSK